MRLPTIDPVSSGRPCAADPWQQVWSHREQLLRVARRRSASIEDAEDAVHEAMVRAAEHPNVDRERLGAWLTSVTIRLCVDRYRQLSRDARVALRVRSMPTASGMVSPEDAACDLAEAKWLALKSVELPGRQAEALRLRAENLDVAQVAQRMGLTCKAVESLLARARRTLRAVLAGTLAVAVGLWRGRPRAQGGPSAVALASTTATFVITGLVLVAPSEGGGAAAPPQPRGSGSVARPAGYDDPQGLSLFAGTDATPGSARPSSRPTGDRRRESSTTRLAVPAPEPAAVLADPVPELSELSELPDLSAVPAAPEDLPTSALPPVVDLPVGPTVLPDMCSRSLNCGAGLVP